MTALLVIIIVLGVSNLISTIYFYVREVKGSNAITELFKTLADFFGQTCNKLDRIEVKVNGLPYKQKNSRVIEPLKNRITFLFLEAENAMLHKRLGDDNDDMCKMNVEEKTNKEEL